MGVGFYKSVSHYYFPDLPKTQYEKNEQKHKTVDIMCQCNNAKIIGMYGLCEKCWTAANGNMPNKTSTYLVEPTSTRRWIPGTGYRVVDPTSMERETTNQVLRLESAISNTSKPTSTAGRRLLRALRL